jgi:hypothetical protein
MIFKFSKEPDGSTFENNQSKTFVECNAIELAEIVSHFEDFLRGCGFIIDGHFEIVEDEL